MSHSGKPTIPATVAPAISLDTYNYDYQGAMWLLRRADREARASAARISRVYVEHAAAETMALCDRIIAGCEARRMAREARLGCPEILTIESVLDSK